jgi:hypothetical protein
METPSPKYATIENWLVISGMGRRTTYDELGLGNLKAIKVGARTLIDVEAGLAWLRSRPAAVIRGPRPATQRTPTAAVRDRSGGSAPPPNSA